MTVQGPESRPRISSNCSDTPPHELGSGPLSVPTASPQHFLGEQSIILCQRCKYGIDLTVVEQNVAVHGANLSNVNMSINHTSHQMDFQDLFGPMIECWDFVDNSMIGVFETDVVGNGYSVDTAHLAMEYEAAQNMEPLSRSGGWGVSRSTQPASNTESPILDLGKIWFTRFPTPEEDSPTVAPLSPAHSPSTNVSDITDISDQYRHRLSKTMLSPLQPDDPLPSSDFLAS